MKFKFRIKPKDLIMFALFCILLLYMCAVLVLNFSTFASEGKFFGLNPIPAFSTEYFPATLVFFVIFLILIFTGLSSYIFDKEKGLGMIFGEKEEKGYSRWATEKELKNQSHIEKLLVKDPSYKAAGVCLINDGKEMWCDVGENHTLVVGATASGKTTGIVDPLVFTLAKAGESMVITDPKGEIYKEHASLLKEKGYNVIVLNFRDPERGSAWNPLALPYRLYKEGKIDKATELLEDVARNILIDPKNPGEPFWENNAADYFAGIALGLFEDAKDESEVNLNSIGLMANAGEESLGRSNYLKEYFNLKGEDSSAYIYASSVINAPNETRGGVVSVFRQKIRLFSSRVNLSEMLSHNDIDMQKIGNEKTAVFLVIHDEKTTYHALATIFIKQCYETLIDVAYKETNGMLKHKTNFILDEFANMPPLKDVTSMVTAARSRAIRFTFIIQNFAQLDSVYGKEDSQTIRSNCGNLMYLITTELAALEEISKLCGEVKSKDKDKTASTPLVTVADLQKLKMNEVIVIRARMNPFKTKLTPSYKMDWGKDYARTEFYSREKSDVNLFSLKDYVQEKKKEKMTEGFGNNDFNPMADNIMPMFDRPNRSSVGNNTSNVGAPMNIDDFIKNIDKQIAELEAQEKKEQEEKNSVKSIVDEVVKPSSEEKNIPHVEESFNIYNKPATKEVKEEPAIIKPENINEVVEKKEEVKPKVNVDKDSIIVDNNVVTDDEFFDDFFGDD